MPDMKVKVEEEQQAGEPGSQVLEEGLSGDAAGEAAAGADAGTDGMQDSSPSTMVWWAFLQLLQERYIERAPPSNLPPLLPKSNAPPRAKKAAPKPGTCVQHHCSTRQHSTAERIDTRAVHPPYQSSNWRCALHPRSPAVPSLPSCLTKVSLSFHGLIHCCGKVVVVVHHHHACY
jgi:hypothetical protein